MSGPKANKTILQGLLVVATVFLHMCGFANGTSVQVYANYRRKGDNATLDISHCSNVPLRFQRNIRSVNTMGNCARFFSELSCTGEKIEIQASAPFQGNISLWNFERKIMSVGPCPDECSEEVIGRTSPHDMIDIRVFPENMCKGTAKLLSVHGCTLIIPEHYRKRSNALLSFDSGVHCVEVYESPDCSNTKGNSVQLRKGNRFNCNLQLWGLKAVQSISHCSYKCRGLDQYTYGPEESDVNYGVVHPDISAGLATVGIENNQLIPAQTNSPQLPTATLSTLPNPTKGDPSKPGGSGATLEPQPKFVPKPASEHETNNMESSIVDNKPEAEGAAIYVLFAVLCLIAILTAVVLVYLHSKLRALTRIT